MLIRVPLTALVLCCSMIGVAPMQNAPAAEGLHPFDMRPQP